MELEIKGSNMFDIFMISWFESDNNKVKYFFCHVSREEKWGKTFSSLSSIKLSCKNSVVNNYSIHSTRKKERKERKHLILEIVYYITVDYIKERRSHTCTRTTFIAYLSLSIDYEWKKIFLWHINALHLRENCGI